MKRLIIAIILILLLIPLLLFFLMPRALAPQNEIKTPDNTEYLGLAKGLSTEEGAKLPTISDQPVITPQAQAEEAGILKEYKLPVLMYHYIRNFNDPSDKIGNNLSVSPATFESQIKYLFEQGYQTITSDQIITKKLPAKPIMITFDDGYDDAYSQAYPILKKYDYVGTFYIITGKVGREGYASWDQLKEMKDADMVIGSHTVTHPGLDKASSSTINKELTESKNTLEQNLGVKVTDFCYPAGKYNSQVIEELKKLGYTNATTVHTGISDQNSDLYELPRIRMENGTDLSKKLK